MPVAQLDMDLIVARSADRHEVAFGIGPASVHWKYVMHFLNGSDSSFLQAALTERMFLDVPVSDSLPLASVFFVMVWRTFIRVVFLCSHRLMLLAISSIGKVRTSWISTWNFLREA